MKNRTYSKTLSPLVAAIAVMCSLCATAQAVPTQLGRDDRLVVESNGRWHQILEGQHAGLWLNGDGLSIWTNGPNYQPGVRSDGVKVWESRSAGPNAKFAYHYGDLMLNDHGSANGFSADPGVAIDRVVMEGCRMKMYGLHNDVRFSLGTDCPPGHVDGTQVDDEIVFDEGCASRGQILMDTPRARLHFQGDGNLVLYRKGPWAAVWASGTAGAGRSVCLRDGEMAIHNAQGTRIWDTGTRGTALRAGNGMFVSARNWGSLKADQATPGRWDWFQFIEQADDSLVVKPIDYNPAYAWGVHTNNWVHGYVQNAAGGQRPETQRFFLDDNQDGTHYIRPVVDDAERLLVYSVYPGDDVTYLEAPTGHLNYRERARARFTLVRAERLVLSGCSLRLANGDHTETLWSSNTSCAQGAPGSGQTFGSAKGFGNYNFGAGYNFGVGYENVAANHYRAFANGLVYGKVFGRQLTVIGANGEARTRNGTHTSSASFEVLGRAVPVNNFDVEERDLFSPIERTFFQKSTTFMAGPVPVRVEGSVTGSVGMKGSYIAGVGGEIMLRPYADLSAGARAGVGVACASAGIQGTLSLINVSVPFTANINAGAPSVELTSDLTVESLSGEVALYADYCVGNSSWTLADWDAPASVTVPLTNNTYTF